MTDVSQVPATEPEAPTSFRRPKPNTRSKGSITLMLII